MTRLWLVRHGPTHEKRFVGWRDVPADLSDVAAITRLHDYLPSNAFLVSSDLKRATETADCLSVGRTRLSHDARLREFNFGRWDGKGFEDVAKSDPDLSRKFWEEPGNVRPPDGESWNDVAGRVSKAVSALHETHFGHDIVVVAHFGVILTQLARALAVPPAQALSHRIDTLSVTRITLGNPGGVLQINHIP